MPISAILFGGRRSNTVPLAVESFNWTHGVYLGATAGAETTAAITGAVGRIRRDPMAMLAFIGYDAGAYFAHWLSMFGRMSNPPKIFLVNWFRKSDEGRYLWPGYGQNMRILKWIIDRAAGRGGAMETPIGYTPRLGDLDLRGIDASPQAIEAACVSIGRMDEGAGGHAIGSRRSARRCRKRCAFSVAPSRIAESGGSAN